LLAQKQAFEARLRQAASRQTSQSCRIMEIKALSQNGIHPFDAAACRRSAAKVFKDEAPRIAASVARLAA
jgi:hypothetical protein